MARGSIKSRPVIKSEFACQSEQPPHLSFVYNFAEIRFYTKESEGPQATRVDAGVSFFSWLHNANDSVRVMKIYADRLCSTRACGFQRLAVDIVTF